MRASRSWPHAAVALVSRLADRHTLHYVTDEAQLFGPWPEASPVSTYLRRGERKNLLRELVDPACKKDVEKLPQHRAQWQLLQRVRWLERADSRETLLPL